MAHITTLTRAYNDLHNSQANTYSYSGSFETFKESEVRVTKNDSNVITTLTYNSSPSDNTQYSVNLTDKTIHVGGGNLTSGTLSIFPITDLGAPTLKAPYTAGSAITASDITNNQLQVMRRQMEFDEKKLANNGDTMTGDLTMGEDTKIIFEGATDNAHETTLTVTDPTADRTITLPNITGTVVTTGDTGTVATGMIANDAINGDKIANDVINSEHYVDGSIDTAHIAADQITNGLIADNQIDSEHYVDGSIVTAHIGDLQITTGKVADDAITNDKIADGTLDGRYYTETESEALFLRQDSSETIASGVTWSGTDSKVATTAAIDLRIIDLLDDVGGFVPIANETSFPTANPDVNNGAGTIVSVKAASTTLTPSGTTVTIANGAGSGNTVTVTGVPSAIASGFGFLVETTTTLHTYTFHRLTPKATEVSTVAANAAAVATVATNVVDVGNFADLYQISSSAPTARSDSSSLTIGDLWFDSSSNKVMMVYDASSGDGFSAITPNQSDLVNISIVAGQITFQEDLGLITNAVNTGSGNNSVNTVGAAIANVNLVGGSIANVNLVGPSISNVNTVAGSISNVNTVGASIANVNTFANTYFISSSAPGSPTNGDLWYDSTNNVLKNYNGSAWLGITSNSGIASVADDSTPQLGGALDGQNNNMSNIGTIDGTNLQLDFGSIA